MLTSPLVKKLSRCNWLQYWNVIKWWWCGALMGIKWIFKGKKGLDCDDYNDVVVDSSIINYGKCDGVIDPVLISGKILLKYYWYLERYCILLYYYWLLWYCVVVGVVCYFWGYYRCWRVIKVKSDRIEVWTGVESGGWGWGLRAGNVKWLMRVGEFGKMWWWFVCCCWSHLGSFSTVCWGGFRLEKAR